MQQFHESISKSTSLKPSVRTKSIIQPTYTVFASVLLETLVSSREMIIGLHGKVFFIPRGINYASLLAEVFLCTYEAEFKVFALGQKETKSQINFTLSNRYINDVWFINKRDFENEIGRINPRVWGQRHESNTSASDVHLPLSIGRDGQRCTFLADKRDDFNFQISNLPCISSTIPSLYIFISQFIHVCNDKACSSSELYSETAERLLYKTKYYQIQESYEYKKCSCVKKSLSFY